MKHFAFSDSAAYMNIAQGVVGEGITNHRHFWEPVAASMARSLDFPINLATAIKQV
ncbi:hypothetical protein [Nostoc sp. FACHB-280]|uniref:hypothetical protein n=1 Tax=Nostoc sp. FACHB-280 TaxID=2692839 RepID=UPI00168B8F6F|nr:hypothetical protein [Nostoc sp. FACHB-280]MBD2497252.1 hypothetical protein [Nostoc sp. FACHB-280]